MKLAYILNTYPQPSHSFIRRELAAIETEGHSVTRLAMRRSGDALVDRLDQAEADRTEYVLDRGGVALCLIALGVFWHAPLSFFAAVKLALRFGQRSEAGRLRHLIYLVEACYVYRATQSHGIAHMHAHFGTNAATVAALTRALGGPTYSFTVHGPEEFDAPRALSLGQKIETSAFTVAVSQFGRSQLCRWVGPEHWSRLHVVHCGIEPGKFDAPKPVPDGPVRFVSIGRFAEQKGQHILIAAMAHLRASGCAAVLHLVGDGPLRPALERSIADAELQDCIVLTGWLDEAGVKAELEAATALIMPSFAEGLPMVIMEAMAAARPVVATYVAGIPELVQETETGWLVPAGDTGALADAMKQVAETPTETLRAMGEAGRHRVLDRHDAHQEAIKLVGYFTKQDAESGSR